MRDSEEGNLSETNMSEVIECVDTYRRNTACGNNIHIRLIGVL